MTGININELQQARYMGLSCPPASSEAKSLVDSIMIIILKSEHAIAFKSAVGLRLGEASGLERSHVDLSPDAPHLIIEETDNRRLKTKTSKKDAFHSLERLCGPLGGPWKPL